MHFHIVFYNILYSFSFHLLFLLIINLFKNILLLFILLIHQNIIQINLHELDKYHIHELPLLSIFYLIHYVNLLHLLLSMVSIIRFQYINVFYQLYILLEVKLSLICPLFLNLYFLNFLIHFLLCFLYQG